MISLSSNEKYSKSHLERQHEDATAAAAADCCHRHLDSSVVLAFEGLWKDNFSFPNEVQKE